MYQINIIFPKYWNSLKVCMYVVDSISRISPQVIVYANFEAKITNFYCATIVIRCNFARVTKLFEFFKTIRYMNYPFSCTYQFYVP